MFLTFSVRMSILTDEREGHDVDYHDMRRQLGSAACLLADY